MAKRGICQSRLRSAASGPEAIGPRIITVIISACNKMFMVYGEISNTDGIRIGL